MLEKSFYRQGSVNLARELLGCELVHNSPDGLASGIIVETEAYHQNDEASHSFGGRKTKRNSVMFGPAGHAYIYFTYGMHFCFNVVAGPDYFAEAVLIRALEPVVGMELMHDRRNSMSAAQGRPEQRTDPYNRVRRRSSSGPDAEMCHDITNLCSGPAKLAKAMGLTREQNGASLLTKSLHIRPRDPNMHVDIAVSPRIGISQAVDQSWRFFVSGSPFISKHKYNQYNEAD